MKASFAKNLMQPIPKFITLPFAVLFLLQVSGSAYAQAAKKDKSWELKGYLNDLQMVQFDQIDDPWMLDNEIHNRLEFTWAPGHVFKTGIALRNRLIFGQTITNFPDYQGMITTDQGLINLTWCLCSGSSFLLVSEFDRAWISVRKGVAELTIGRQRINYGQTFVWNPNDIFNTYSFYAIDYPERPGSDAIRLQIFPSATSVIEGAVKWDNQGKITIAALSRVNVGHYDIQFLGGLMNDQDYVLGMGWSGNISQTAFRGEISYFYPKKNFSDTSGLLSATIGLDYTFANSLSLIFQVFYDQLPPEFQPESMLDVYQAPMSAKTLAFTEWNIFLQGSYPITPLFDVTLAGIYFPDLNGFFLGPSCNYNLKQTMDLSFFIQYFNGRFKNTGPQQNQNMYFNSFLSALRLKWSF